MIKLSKYKDRCLTEIIKFCPIVCETTGARHREAEKTLKRLGQALARATGGDEKEVVSHMFGRLSVLLQRDNGMILLEQDTNSDKSRGGWIPLDVNFLKSSS